jgi:hypothetical protein
VVVAIRIAGNFERRLLNAWVFHRTAEAVR